MMRAKEYKPIHLCCTTSIGEYKLVIVLDFHVFYLANTSMHAIKVQFKWY